MGSMCRCPPSELENRIGWEHVFMVDAVVSWEPSVET